MAISALVLYEWRRGPRTREELEAQEALFPSEAAIAFGPAEAARAAQLYSRLPNARGREIDLAIAASALTSGAAILTLNRDDFNDIPDLQVL